MLYFAKQKIKYMDKGQKVEQKKCYWCEKPTEKIGYRTDLEGEIMKVPECNVCTLEDYETLILIKK